MARILIADDEPDVREFMEGFLRLQGHEVETASDGIEAIEKIKAACPDLVLLDMRMPRMEGIEVLRELKQLAPRLSVVMMTAVRDQALAKEAIALGAFDYVTKPVDLSRLKLLLDTRLIQMER